MTVERFGRFSLIGLAGAALQLLMLWLLTKTFRVPAAAITPVVVELVILHNFVWHDRFTWRDRLETSPRERLARLIRFHAGNGLISLLGNTAIMYIFAEELKVPVLISAALAMGLCSIVNYRMADRWVYVKANSP